MLKVMREQKKFDNWEEWRWKYFYTLDVHDVIFANLDSLTVLFKAYCEAPINYMSMQNTI